MNGNNGCGPLIAVIFGAALLVSLVQSCNNNDTGVVTPTPPDRSSFEHRYAKERVKLEGYSDREAQQAADAIVRFHEAQKSRK